MQWFLAALCLVVPAREALAARAAAERAANVILMIADGCGQASVTLARLVHGAPLALDSILVGSVSTGSADSRITDSAAGATAYASGYKTKNRMLGRDSTGRTLVTVLERVRAKGMATGLVVKSTITDATPGAFAAHVHNRAAEDSVAAQELALGVDLLLGGGREWLLPGSEGGSRRDSIDLIRKAREKGYHYASNPAELAKAELPLLGLFAPEDMAYALDRDPAREPSLPEMAEKALALLSRSPKGFFLMIEGSRIDHGAHGNDPGTHVSELLEYDEAVRLALRFARRDGHTLVVTTADHECGGLGLGRRLGERSIYALNVESLRAIKASTERMSDSIQAGMSMDSVIARYTGAGLDSAERAILAPAVKAKKQVALAIAQIESRRALLDWTSGGHTAVDVGLYAFGPGSEPFRGHHENTEIAWLLADALGVTLSPPAGRMEATAGASGGKKP